MHGAWRDIWLAGTKDPDVALDGRLQVEPLWSQWSVASGAGNRAFVDKLYEGHTCRVCPRVAICERRTW